MRPLPRLSCHCGAQVRPKIDERGVLMSPVDKPTRREFLLTTFSAALGAAVPLAGSQPDSPAADAPATPVSDALTYSSEELFASGPQRTFTGDRAAQIAMPVGGIGAGGICLNGTGALQGFSIGNHPP